MSNSTFKFKIKDFEKVITKHNQNKTTLEKWRKAFAEPAMSKELAAFAKKAFPMIPGNIDDLAKCFSFKNDVSKNDAFKPWNGKWCGTWDGQWGSDASTASSSDQYHIWDDTVGHGFQYIQPVTQSTSVFFNSKKFKEYVDDKKSLDKSLEVDLGINVWSQKNNFHGGLTGWVSKRQGKPGDETRTKEMPHIAYLYNQNTLIWIAQVWEKDNKDGGGRYYMFYETAGNNKYSIQGQTFTIGPAKKITGFKIGVANYKRVDKSSDECKRGN